MFFGSKRLIGVDIGSHSIKIADIDAGKSGLEVNGFWMVPTPVNAVHAGEISDPVAISTVLQNIFVQNKIKNTKVSIGLSGTLVIIKKIQMPMVDEKVLAEQIRFEAEQYIPFDINSISLSYYPIGGLKRDPLEILLVAAQNSGIQKHLELLKASGLDLKCIDVSGFALANAFELSMGRQRGEILGVLNFGASSSNFVVLRNGETLFSRDISIGGQNHTLEIHKTLGMSIEEAEAMKISVANGQEAPQEVLNAIQVVNDSLLDELKSALDFITATMDGLQVSKIYFTGGAADTPNLVRSLEQGVQVPFQRFNAFNKVTSIGKGVDKNFLQSAARFAAVAVGLGCRKLGDV